jgi:hypothetical protein
MNLFMNDFDHLFFTCCSVLSILIYLGGGCACLMFRRLSPWLMMVASGFGGLIAARLLPFVTSTVFRSNLEMGYLLNYAATALSVLSNLLLAFGLGLALIQIRRQVALSLEPNHGRR